MHTDQPFRLRCGEVKHAASMFSVALLACGILFLPSASLSAAEKLSWKAGDKGSQGFWHQWPDKIYAGAIHFTASKVDVIPKGFTFSAYNVYADCAYKATRGSSRANNIKPGDMDATKRMLFSRAFPMDKLPKMTEKGQQFHLPAKISDVKAGGGTFTAVFTFAGEDVTCKVERTKYKITINPAPDIRDMRYGPHFRQTIDFYKAKSDKPTPLVVSIHGGGWGALDKSMLQIYVSGLLSQGISVASINYRYCGQGEPDKLEPPVAAPLLDAARAIQFLRSEAGKLNIDKERIAATGGSAGGCSSLWLAFHDDLADPNSSDPVARESTRLFCVGGTGAQTSLDPKQLAKWLPGITYGPHAFGVSGHGKSREAVFREFLDNRDKWLVKRYIQEYSPWALVTSDDPPAYLEFPGTPLDPKPGQTEEWQTHSPRFGFQLKKRMEELGLECHLTYKGVKDPEYPNMVDFFVKKLKTATPACVLSGADTMQKVFRDEPWDSPGAARLTIEAARNEVEGIQLVVKPVAGKDIRGATLEISDLKGNKGRVISKSHVRWHVVGYVKTTKPAYPAPKVGWWPDPLLPDRTFNVKAGSVQPLWINVHVPQNAAAGIYQGTVALRLADGSRQSIPLELRVWDFTVPHRQHLETCFLLRPDQLKKFYKLPKVTIEMYERWIDFCLDHRISLTLNDWPNYAKDMERLAARQLDRGGASFCLAVAWFQKGEPEARRQHNKRMVEQIKGLYDRAKRRGWLDRAYVYCHDEVGKEHYPFARELYGALKKAMPDLRLMQTFYKDEPVAPLGDVLDVWAPNIARYRQAEFQAQQAKGKGVWWYVCCGPLKPYANMMIEWPGIDHRILPWQNWRYGVTGFLYWGTAVCGKNADGPKRWPDAPWDPATFRNKAGEPYNGDGQLIYPGPGGMPLSSVRLENLRDGIEDYEYFWLLRDAVTRLKKSGSAKHRGLIAEAAKALAVDKAVVKDVTHFTDNAQVLRKARATLARLIERSTAAAAAAQSPNDIKRP